MAKETVNGVGRYYGPRTSYEGVGGTQATRDDRRYFVVDFSGESILAGAVAGVLPAGATIRGPALIEVREAFALGGTTPTINVGVQGSHGTNYLAELSEANAEAVGTYSAASAGTLAVNTPLSAAATIVVGLDGTNPTVTGVGKARLIIPYESL
jgi:hypothetical protein